jgi:DNA-directed RNA polymerase subunit E'/Rpb7
MNPSQYSVKDETWIWEFESQQFYYEVGEQVRLRVEAEIWHDKTPGKEVAEGAPEKHDVRNDEVKVPYTIIGSMADPCLGCLLWWEGEDKEETNGMEVEEVADGGL